MRADARRRRGRLLAAPPDGRVRRRRAAVLRRARSCWTAISIRAMESQPELDVVVVGAGFAGLYALHGCAAGVARPRVRGGRRRRRHVVLEPLPGRALRRREPRLPVLLLRRAAAGVAVDRALPGAGGDPPLPRARRRPLRPASRHLARHARDRRRCSTRRRHAGPSRPTRARSVTAPLLHHGHRLPVGAEGARGRPASDAFAGEMPPHRPLAARGRRLHRQARRRRSAPARPASRRSRTSPSRRPSSPCSSARRTSARPRGTARSTRRPRARSSRGYAERRKAIRESLTSLALPRERQGRPRDHRRGARARARGALRGGRPEHGRRASPTS